MSLPLSPTPSKSRTQTAKVASLSPHTPSPWHRKSTNKRPNKPPYPQTSPTNKPPNSRFGSSSLHQRDPRSALFENYNGGGAGARSASSNSSPSRAGGYGYNGASGTNGLGAGLGGGERAYRPATPNSRYVFSIAVVVGPRGRGIMGLHRKAWRDRSADVGEKHKS